MFGEVLERTPRIDYLWGVIEGCFMPHKPRLRPSSSVRKGAKPLLVAARKRAPVVRASRPSTVEEGLEAKALAADQAVFTGPSLGEMTREQRHKILYGE